MNRPFEYMLLGRLSLDCKNFLDKESSKYMREDRLYHLNIHDQIQDMKRLWNELEVKPEWITFKDIENFEKEMKLIK